MGPVVASAPVGLSWLWHDHADEGRSPTVQPLRVLGDGVKYSGIDRCVECGRPLEKGQWLVGLCRQCEQEGKDAQTAPRIWDSGSRGRSEE